MQEHLSQEAFLSRVEQLNPDKAINIYLDFPFCYKKCAYCTFNPMVAHKSDAIVQVYFDAMRKFLDTLSDMKLPPIDTVYLGGGTPNFMPPAFVKELLTHLSYWKTAKFRVADMHPALITDAWLDFIFEAGFTKIDMGVQSFQKEVIAANGRIYASWDKLSSLVSIFRNHGIHTTIDLMGYISTGKYDVLVPDMDRMMDDLLAGGDLMCDIISLYAEEKVCASVKDPREPLRAFHQCIHDACKLIPYSTLYQDAIDFNSFIAPNGGMRTNCKIVRNDIVDSVWDWYGSYVSSYHQSGQNWIDSIAFGGLRGRKSAYGALNDLPYTSRFDMDGTYSVYLEH